MWYLNISVKYLHTVGSVRRLLSKFLQQEYKAPFLPRIQPEGFLSRKNRTASLNPFPVEDCWGQVRSKCGLEMGEVFLSANSGGAQALPWTWNAENTVPLIRLPPAHEAEGTRQQMQAKRLLFPFHWVLKA